MHGERQTGSGSVGGDLLEQMRLQHNYHHSGRTRSEHRGNWGRRTDLLVKFCFSNIRAMNVVHGARTGLRVEILRVADLHRARCTVDRRVVTDRIASSNISWVYWCICFALCLGLADGILREFESSTRFHEIWQQSFPIPSRVPEGFPRIVVVFASPIPAHGIENTSTTKYLSLRHRPCGTIKLHLGNGGKVPIVLSTDVRTNIDWILDYGLIVITRIIRLSSWWSQKTYASPASMQSTVTDASSDNRFVTTKPLIPQPTTI